MPIALRLRSCDARTNRARCGFLGKIPGACRNAGRRDKLFSMNDSRCDPQPDAIHLHAPNGDEALVLLRGGELAAWRSVGVELIAARDPSVWDQTAPLLFPVVGWTRGGRVRVDSVSCPLGLHGFARQKDFAVLGHDAASIRLALVDDADTRALYPFPFRFEVEYRLDAGALYIALVVTNVGDRPMPYACGLHPAFRWPLAGAAGRHAIIFEKPETPAVPVITPDGLFSARTRPVPLDGARLALSPELFAREALCFLDINSRKLAFDNGAGAQLSVLLHDFPHLGLWSPQPAPFLCIEPWTGYGDPEDFSGELRDKPSMRSLAAGQSARHGATFVFRAAPV
jgi:galactose mutarotase-like enzyme